MYVMLTWSVPYYSEASFKYTMRGTTHREMNKNDKNMNRKFTK